MCRRAQTQACGMMVLLVCTSRAQTQRFAARKLTFSAVLQAGAGPRQACQCGAGLFLLLEHLAWGLGRPEHQWRHCLRPSTVLSRSGACPCCIRGVHELTCQAGSLAV